MAQDYRQKVEVLLEQCLVRRIEASKFLAFAHQARRKAPPSPDSLDSLAEILTSRLLCSKNVDPLLFDYLRHAVYGAQAPSGTSSDEGAICDTLDVILSALAHCWNQAHIGSRLELLLTALESIASIISQGLMVKIAAPGAFQPASAFFRSKLVSAFGQSEGLASPPADGAAGTEESRELVAVLGYLSANLLLLQLASTANVTSPQSLLAPRIGMTLLTHSGLHILAANQTDLKAAQASLAGDGIFPSEFKAAAGPVRQVIQLIETTLSTLNPSWESEIALLRDLGGQLGRILPLLESTSSGSNQDGLVPTDGAVASLASVDGKQPAWDHFIDVQALTASSEGQQSTKMQPELALLLRHLVDVKTSWSSKIEAVQMLLTARREEAAPSVSLDQTLTAFYYELLSGAAEVCSLVVETPSILRGSAEATLWRNVLCGMIPGMIAQLEQSVGTGLQLRGERAVESHVRVESALKALLVASPEKLTSCGSGSAGQRQGGATSSSSHDPAAMLDSVIGEETPVHQPVRAWLLRSLIEAGLARPEAITDEFPDGHKLAEEVQSLSQSLRMDAQLEGLDISSSLENKVANDDFTELCDRVCQDPGVHCAFAHQLLSQSHFWLESQDYDSFARCCKSLAANVEALDTITLYFDPAELAVMLASLLDRGDIGQVSDEPSTLCSIILLLQLICHRYSVDAEAILPPDNADSFFARFMRSPAAVYRLADLASDERALVGRWVSALFDNEGVSDELSRDSSPRTMLRLAPTLFSQSINACISGMIDLETLRGGLSYFLQDLLSYTLPGALLWLLREVQRVPLMPLVASSTTSEDVLLSCGLSKDATTRTVHFEVVGLILDSDSCPTPVRHIIGADFERLVAGPDLNKSLAGVESFSLDSVKVKMDGFQVSPMDVASAAVWLRPHLGPLASSELLAYPSASASLRLCSSDTAASLVLQRLAASPTAETVQGLASLLVLNGAAQGRGSMAAMPSLITAVFHSIDLETIHDATLLRCVARLFGLALVLLRNLGTVQASATSSFDVMSDETQPPTTVTTQTWASETLNRVAGHVTLKLARLSRSRPEKCREMVDALRNAKGELTEPALLPLVQVLEVTAAARGSAADKAKLGEPTNGALAAAATTTATAVQ